MEKSLSPLFEGISPESRAAMKACFDVREQRFRADEVIYDFAARRDIIGILAEGSAVVERIDRQGGRTILEHLESGGVFGEMLMFENVAGDSITVVAQRPCRVWFMAASQVTKRCENACAHHSRMVENMFHLVADKATALSERVEVLSRRSIRDRLLCYFNLCADHAKQTVFSIPFTGTALADYLCVDRSAMLREIRKLKNEGMIEMDKRQVTARFLQ